MAESEGAPGSSVADNSDVGDAPARARTLNQRLLQALRQAGLVAIALLIAGLVTERLRPDELLDRGIASTTFLWAIVAWLGVLLFNAIAFERPQIGVLEGKPLIGALTIGALVFIVGLVSLQEGSFGRRVIYLFANSLGAVMFWWALLSMTALAMLRMTRD